jgi:hypothetical protein
MFGAADTSGTNFIRLFPRSKSSLRLIQHSIIADNPDAARLWRLEATFANPVLESLEGRKARYGAGAVIGFGLDEMDEAVVVEPQRKIANAFGPRRFQFREYIADQFGVLFGHVGFCLIPDQGPFHHSLQKSVFEGLVLMACSCLLDVGDGAEDSVTGKIFEACSFHAERYGLRIARFAGFQMRPTLGRQDRKDYIFIGRSKTPETA